MNASALKAPLSTESPILTLKEAADYLHISKAHLSNVINGKVPGVMPMLVKRVGRRVLIRREWIERWLEQSGQSTAL